MKSSFYTIPLFGVLVYVNGELNKISKTAIYRHTMGFPEQIEFALNVNIGKLPKVSKVCICGMGASGMAGDIMTDFADGFSDIPIPVIRGIELPKWVDSDTLVIVITYSGDTKEVLCLYDRAAAIGCRIVCITSGGELLRRCVTNNDTLIKVPLKTSSRGSLGYILGFLASVFEEAGICNSKEELQRMIPSLKGFRDELLEDTNSTAASISSSLEGKIPVIYGLTNMRSSAIRWKTQINENSKMIAFCGIVPEFNHNEIVGWTEDSTSNNFVPVFLYDEDASEMMRIVVDTTIKMLVEKGIDVKVFKVHGNNMEKNLKCIILGDLVSLYLANSGNVDPCSVAAVSKVRERISDSE